MTIEEDKLHEAVDLLYKALQATGLHVEGPDRRVLIDDKIYTAKELARVLRISEDSINKMAKAGKIPYFNMNSRRVYLGWQIKEWVDKGTKFPMQKGE